MKKGNSIRCFMCSNHETGLVMVSHRDKYGFIVGWVFCCPECMGDIMGKHINVSVDSKSNVEMMGNAVE